MFVITKSLSGYYKNPQGIAHKVLADRMAERNPGNKPKPNDRIPYMYIKVDESPIPNGFYKNGKQKFLKRKILHLIVLNILNILNNIKKILITDSIYLIKL